MPSSTSSFDSEPVLLRAIPELSWPRVALVAWVLAALGLGAWEAYWRVAQQYEASYRNSDGQWAEVRRRIDAREPNATVFIGSSRTLFDIDLDVWKEETGVHGIQLALEGSNPLPVLADVANDDDFSGLLVVGITPPLLFLPGHRTSGGRHRILLRRDAVAADLDPALVPARDDVRVLQHGYEALHGARSAGLVARTTEPSVPAARGAQARAHAARPAGGPLGACRNRPGVPRDCDRDLAGHPREPAAASAGGRGARAIRGLARPSGRRRCEDPRAWRRGGVHPTAVRDAFREAERKITPRERVWEPIVGAAGAVGVHFEDYPALSDVRTPEWSHISAKDKARWTRALIGILRKVMSERGVHRSEVGS